MNNLTTGCIFCGTKSDLSAKVRLRTDEGIKKVYITICNKHFFESQNLHEEVQEVIGDPIKWSNFWEPIHLKIAKILDKYLPPNGINTAREKLRINLHRELTKLFE